MNQILMVEASPVNGDSKSRRLAWELEARLRAAYPYAQIVRRDLAAAPVPHLDEAAVRAIGSRAGADPALKLSDELVSELLGSDLVVIATPMWNFGIPSALKAWVDHVVRAGKTFSYSASGPVGHAKGKKAILIAASGGVYSSGPMQAFDFVVPYLQRVLGFIGITDVQTIRVEGQGSPSLAEKGFAEARKALDGLGL